MTARLTRWDSLDKRLWNRILYTDGCWYWTGPLDRKGYGAPIGHERRTFKPHRLVYELKVGPIPDGMVLDHLCRVRHCVNPAHLEPVTPGENTLRGVGPLALKARATALGYCLNGHPTNQYRRQLPSGKSICVECRRLADARRDERDRDARRLAARRRYARGRAA